MGDLASVGLRADASGLAQTSLVEIEPGFGKSFDLSTLDGSNGFRINGDVAEMAAGLFVSGAGDVNADGYDDFLVGQAVEGGHGRLADQAYLIFGAADGFPATLNLADIDGDNGCRLDGFLATDRASVVVDKAGDVNGDGFDDVIISDPYDPGSAGSRSGVSYVVYGGAAPAGPELDVRNMTAAQGFAIHGEVRNDLSGWSVSSAGDINGDGHDDLIIGAREADSDDAGSRDFLGAGYVVFGKAGGFGTDVELADLNGTNGFRIDGGITNGETGSAVTTAGDFNGDGFDDVAISSPSYEVDVIFGHAGDFADEVHITDLGGSVGLHIIGANRYSPTRWTRPATSMETGSTI